MRNITKQIIYLFLLFSILNSGCISKKKHLEAIASMRSVNENVVADWQQKFNDNRQELNLANEEIEKLKLDLAERKGENNILVSLRDELQSQIDQMESQMSNLGTKSQSTQQSLNSKLTQKDQEIDRLKKQLRAVSLVLNQHQELLKKVRDDFAFEMQSFMGQGIEVTTQFDEIKIIVPEKSLFKSKSASRLTDSGIAVLEKVSEILNRYPNFYAQVVGHTDNKPADKKRYKDNWNFSSLQSATIVRTLIGDFYTNSSQISVGAKAEFEPRDSNATSEGKEKNRRIEFVVFRQGEDLAKEVKKVVGVR